MQMHTKASTIQLNTYTACESTCCLLLSWQGNISHEGSSLLGYDTKVTG